MKTIVAELGLLLIVSASSRLADADCVTDNELTRFGVFCRQLASTVHVDVSRGVALHRPEPTEPVVFGDNILDYDPAFEESLEKQVQRGIESCIDEFEAHDRQAAGSVKLSIGEFALNRALLVLQRLRVDYLKHLKACPSCSIIPSARSLVESAGDQIALPPAFAAMDARKYLGGGLTLDRPHAARVFLSHVLGRSDAAYSHFLVRRGDEHLDDGDENEIVSRKPKIIRADPTIIRRRLSVSNVARPPSPATQTFVAPPRLPAVPKRFGASFDSSGDDEADESTRKPRALRRPRVQQAVATSPMPSNEIIMPAQPPKRARSKSTARGRVPRH